MQSILETLKLVPKEKWQELGLKLGLFQPTLNTIETNYPKDVERCFRECLTAWIRREDDVDKHGQPTLLSLAEAFEEIDRATADRLHNDLHSNLCKSKLYSCIMMEDIINLLINN